MTKRTTRRKADQLSLHPVQGSNRYCGPTSIAAVTGCTTDEAATIIQHSRANRRPVQGIYNHELTHARRELGYQYDHEEYERGYRHRPHAHGGITLHRFDDRPTLSAWLRDPAHRQGTWIVQASRHYIVVQGDHVLDTGAWYTPRTPVRIRPGMRMMRVRVNDVWRVTEPVPEPEPGQSPMAAAIAAIAARRGAPLACHRSRKCPLCGAQRLNIYADRVRCGACQEECSR